MCHCIDQAVWSDAEDRDVRKILVIDPECSHYVELIIRSV